MATHQSCLRIQGIEVWKADSPNGEQNIYFASMNSICAKAIDNYKIRTRETPIHPLQIIGSQTVETVSGEQDVS